jgi:ubiquinone/menaquinone biosynthesis C-methylase UbiE
MTTPQEHWQDEKRARRFARQSSLASRLVYAPFARKIVAYLSPSDPSPTIVDLGSGPGQLAIELSRLRPQATIVSVDPSSEMLQIARENAGKAALANYEARLGTAEEMPLESDSVDLVVSQSSFHEWEDQQEGLAEIYRVLRPGGSLILKDYNLAWLSSWKRKLLGRFHHLDMFRFGTEEVATLLREAGFDQIQSRGRGMQYFMHAQKG